MSPMPQAPALLEDPVRIEICENAVDLHRHAAALVVASAGRALGSRARFRLALTGDEAMWPVWDLLPQPHFAHQIVWAAVSLYRLDDAGEKRIAALRTAVGIADENYHPLPLGAETGEPLRFDLAMVVLGPDGGIGQLAVPIEMLNQSAVTCVLASGDACADAVRRVLGAEARDEGLPAQSLKPAGGRLLWLLDQAAASSIG